MKQKIKIALLGGTGRSGKYIVNQLLKQGYSIKLLVRNPDTFKIQDERIEPVYGDAIHPEVIHALAEDCHAVISAIGQRKNETLVYSLATQHVLNAMQAFNIRRYILLTGINVDTPFDNKSAQTIQATDWMKANYYAMHKEWQDTYNILAKSDLDWTLVRVPLIEFVEEKRKVSVNVADCRGTKISASDIGAFVVAQLNDNRYLRQAPFISNI